VHQERRQIRLTFGELERLGGNHPAGVKSHPPAALYGYQRSGVARAIVDRGWHTSRVDLQAETLTLVPARSRIRRSEPSGPMIH
jgi:hypothetical protein